MLLGLDLGTGSVKALLIDAAGTRIAEASHSYAVQAPAEQQAESAPQDWWQAVITVCQELPEHARQNIKAIGLSGQMHGVVLCDTNGAPLRNAILWADRRSTQQLELYRALPDASLRALANPLVVGMAGPSLLWLRAHEPDVYAAARWALQPKDWLRLKLTGNVASEPSDASATLLYDMFADNWADDVIEQLGLRRALFAPLIASSAVAGNLTADAAKQLGLPAGLPVAAGAADTAASALGSGLLNAGQSQLTVGTGAQILTSLDTPAAAPQFGIHVYRAALTDRYYAMAAMQNAGLALEWVRALFGLSWQGMYEAFDAVSVQDGLVFLPFLNGERTPHLNPDARGVWFGLSPQHDARHMVRAAFEGVAFSIADGFQALQKTGVTVQRLRLAGGGTRERSWQQLIADVLQTPLESVQVLNASAQGAAFLGGLAAGVFKDETMLPVQRNYHHVIQPQTNDALARSYASYQQLYRRLFT